MAVDMEQVQAAIDRADEEAIVRLFDGVSEKDRRAVAGEIRKILRATPSFIEKPRDTFSYNPSERTAELAVLATSPVSDIPEGVSPSVSHKAGLEIVLQRPVTWIESYADHELDRGERCHWSVVLDLMRRGYCDPIENDTFVLGMINGLHWLRRDVDVWSVQIAEVLEENTDLLDRAFWRIFEITETQGRGVANFDHWRGNKSMSTWQGAVLQLSQQGRLPRERLLESSAGALCRPFNRNEARWFADLFEKLDPDPAERERYADLFFRHLRSDNPAVVQFGLKQLERIEKARKKEKQEPLPPEPYSEALPSMLRHTSKTMVKKTFSLMKRLAKLTPGSVPRLAELVCELLVDESPDVQAITLDFMEQLVPEPNAHLRGVLAGYRDAVAASLRKRFDGYVSEDEDPSKKTATPTKQSTTTPMSAKKTTREGARKPTDKTTMKTRDPFGIAELHAAVEEEAPTLRPIDAEALFALPRCTPDREVSPVASVEELIEVCSTWIESPEDPEDVDRILDGILRFRDAGSGNEFEKASAPLVKRVAKRCGDYTGATLLTMILIHLWAREGWPEVPEENRAYFEGLELGEHPSHKKQALELLEQLLARIRRSLSNGTPLAFLSPATHRGGWLDPCVLVDRWIAARDAGHEVLAVDVVRGLLRLAPDWREAALRQLEKEATTPRDQIESAIRYSLGDSSVEIGSDVALWAAAARARNPREDDRQLADARPSLSEDFAVRRECRFFSRIDPRGHLRVCIPGIENDIDEEADFRIPLGRHFIWPLQYPFRYYEERSLSNILHFWPSGWNTYCLVATTTLIDNVDWWEARWDNRRLLEPLLDPDYPLTLPAALLLSVGLACKEPGEHGLASDIAIAAIDDGRLTAENFGPGLRIVFGCRGIAPSRWAKTLRDVSGVSTLHAYVVFGSMVASLPPAKDGLPKNPAAYFELMNELSAELGLGIGDEGARKMFGEFKGSGKSAKLAKSLLAAQMSLSDEARAEIVERAIEGRERRLGV